MTAEESQLASCAIAVARELVDGRTNVSRVDDALTRCDILVALRELQRCYFDGSLEISAVLAYLLRVSAKLRDLGTPADDRVLAFLERELALIEQPVGGRVEFSPWRLEPFASVAPTMSTPDVLRYYRWLARTAPLAGPLVDLGCWYGASTFALADGITARSDTVKERVIAVDTFRCEQWMAAYDPDCSVGDSFLPRFRAQGSAFGDLVTPIQCDVANDDDWARTIRGPVGVLVYDIDRSAITLARVLAVAASRFVVGETILVLATYGHLASQSIREWVSQRRDRLQPLHAPSGPVRSFRIVGAVA